MSSFSKLKINFFELRIYLITIYDPKEYTALYRALRKTKEAVMEIASLAGLLYTSITVSSTPFRTLAGDYNKSQNFLLLVALA